MYRKYPFAADYRLGLALCRARKHGLDATLTQIDWRSTLQHFNFNCAYCLTARYEVIEHFISITKGGGTTKWNCVPSCRRCNVRKDSCHPQVKAAFPQDALERVKAFLDEHRIAQALGVKTSDLLVDEEPHAA